MHRRLVSIALAVAAACLGVSTLHAGDGPDAKDKPAACNGILADVAGVATCLKPGETFRDCPTCPEMVVVPPGSFQMGATESSDEEPIHAVTLKRPFAAGKFEVTFALWDACVADGGCRYSPSDQRWGRGDHPVFNVSWVDVTTQFLPWLSAQAGTEYRLLSEAEWEYAARAGTSTIYWWGDEVGRNNANCDGCGSAWDYRQPAPVGSFAPNAFGLHDMHGNVWEWAADCFASYEKTPVDGSPMVTEKCRTHSVRGGGWSDKARYLRASLRYGDTNTYRSTYVGFRVARGL